MLTDTAIAAIMGETFAAILRGWADTSQEPFFDQTARPGVHALQRFADLT